MFSMYDICKQKRNVCFCLIISTYHFVTSSYINKVLVDCHLWFSDLLQSSHRGFFSFIMQLSYRLNCASCPSVCPVQACNSKMKNIETAKLLWMFLRGRVSEMPILSSDENVKVTGRQKNKPGVVFTYSRPIKCKWVRRWLQSAGYAYTSADYAYTIARPNLLSSFEHKTLGNWTDGHISFQHSAVTWFLVFTITCLLTCLPA